MSVVHLFCLPRTRRDAVCQFSRGEEKKKIGLSAFVKTSKDRTEANKREREGNTESMQRADRTGPDLVQEIPSIFCTVAFSLSLSTPSSDRPIVSVRGSEVSSAIVKCKGKGS